MKKQTKVAIIAGAILVVVGAAAVLYEKLILSFAPETMVITEEAGTVTSGAQNVSTTANQAEAPTVPAPNFTVLDTSGKEVPLHSLVGKPIILNFWASWCPPCKQEMPDFEAAYKKYGSDIQFMMVNLTDGGRETIATAEQYIKSQGYSFPVYFDTKQEAAIEYGVSAIPTTYFINTQGNIIAYAAGAITAQHLEQGISMMQTN
jgi:thiol-disulfide isomerase/thioredoxin